VTTKILRKIGEVGHLIDEREAGTVNEEGIKNTAVLMEDDVTEVQNDATEAEVQNVILKLIFSGLTPKFHFFESSFHVI
jgi:hypothetical protein